MDERIRAKYGPWAVVTGASDGIGLEFARQLAAEGLALVLVARRREVLEGIAAELRARGSAEVRVCAADLSVLPGVEAVIDATRELEVGLLVAAAGFGTSGAFLEADLAAELEMIDVNCRAVAALTHHFGGRLAQRGRGGIVLLSSLVAFQGVPWAAHYAATKAYIQVLAEGLRAELAPRGVDVIASAPGPVRSGFAARASMELGLAEEPATVAAGTLRMLGRLGTVRPGLLSKLLEASLALLPRWGRVKVMGQVMGQMTRHQSGLLLLVALASLISACATSVDAIQQSRRFSEQIRWPADYTPEESSFFVHNEIAIQAPPEVVWDILIQAETWPDWYEGASNVAVIGESAPLLQSGVAFTWTTMGLDFTSTIREFDPPYRLSWESEKAVIRGYHAWLIIPQEDGGCILLTDESQNGFLTFFEGIFQPDKLRELHDLWLLQIKRKAEAQVRAAQR